MAEILIYGVIDSYVTSDVMWQLRSATGDLLVRINSVGGFSSEGVAIYNALRRYDKGKCIVEVDGMAASSASIVAMVGDEIRVPDGALLMIHKAWAGTVGDDDDHESQMNMLRKTTEEMAKIYAARTGQTVEECKRLMAATTWMGAEEAKSLGFCDTVLPAKRKPDLPEEGSAAAKMLASFKNLPAALTRTQPAPRADVAHHAAPLSTPLSQLARRA